MKKLFFILLFPLAAWSASVPSKSIQGVNVVREPDSPATGDILQWVNISSVLTNWSSIPKATSGKVLQAGSATNGFGFIVNANIDPAAAIALSKLATVPVVAADIDTLAELNSIVTDADLVPDSRTISAGPGMSGGGSLGANRTLTWDASTFVNNLILWDGASASRTITYSLSGATDPVWTVGNNSMDLTTGVLKYGGNTVATVGGALGVASVTSLNKWTFTTPTTAATLTAGGDSLTYTMPASSQTMVGQTSTDTLVNKTLTSPTLTTPIILNEVRYGRTALTDASTIAIDLSLGESFIVTLGGNRTLGVPTNGRDRQSFTIWFVQDTAGSRTITFPTNYVFGGDINTNILTTTAGKGDKAVYEFFSTNSVIRPTGFIRGYQF